VSPAPPAPRGVRTRPGRPRPRLPWPAGVLAALCAGLLVAGLAAGPAPVRAADPPAAAPATTTDRRTQIRQLGRERTQAQQQLEQIKASESELRSEIEKLAELVGESHQRKEALAQRIQREQAVAAQQQKEARRLEDEIKAGQRRIGQRLRRLYRFAKQGNSALLFQMARYRTFAKDTRYVALLQDADLAAIAHYEELGQQLVEKKQQVEASLQRLLALRQELDDESKQLADREAFLHAAMSDAAKNRTMYRKYLADVQQMMTRMETAVTRMEQQSRTAAAPPAPKLPKELRGTLPPPVDGKVIAAFGAQDPRYDLKKLQRGIVVRVAAKAAVKAVAAGRAVHAGPFRGYQALVVLDHGHGLFTVYGHLQDLKVKRGDWVPQGTVLGQATYQPVDDAYDVYFEIRNDGKPDDPLAWIKPGGLRLAANAASAGG